MLFIQATQQSVVIRFIWKKFSKKNFFFCFPLFGRRTKMDFFRWFLCNERWESNVKSNKIAFDVEFNGNKAGHEIIHNSYLYLSQSWKSSKAWCCIFNTITKYLLLHTKTEKPHQKTIKFWLVTCENGFVLLVCSTNCSMIFTYINIYTYGKVNVNVIKCWLKGWNRAKLSSELMRMRMRMV